jgi:hypothetical protein
MEAISISDSMRFEKYRAIMWSTLTSNSDAILSMNSKKFNESNNITISFINTRSKNSPYYKKHAKEVNVIFSQLSLSVDVDSINRLIPYAEAMSDIISKNSAKSTVTTLYDTDANTRSITDTENIAQAAQSIGTISINMSVDRVALELMQLTKIKPISRKIPPQNPFATPLKVPLPKEIEVAFTSVMSGLSLHFDMGSDQISSNIALADFSVSDNRSEFASYHYKEMICRSKLASEFSNPSIKKDHPSIKSDEDNNLLTISFTQEGNPHPSTIVVDILLRDATALVTFGRTMQLLKLTNEIANAGLLLSSKFSEKGNNASPASKKSTNAVATTRRKTEKRDSLHKLSKRQSNARITLVSSEDLDSYIMNVTVKIANPRILILENRSNEHSKAIVMRSNIIINYCQDVKSKIRKEIRESIHLSILNAEIFSLYGGLRNGIPLQIVEPAAIDFHLNRRCECGLVLSVSVNFDADDLIAKISLKDLMLVKSVWAHSSLKDFEKLASTTSSSDSSADENNDVGDGNTRNITMYDIQFHMNTVKVVLINDLLNDNNPVLQFHIDSINASGGGALGMWEYEIEGNILCHTDFYNTRTATCEPILEKCQPTFSIISTSSTGGLFELKYDSTMHFNLSGAMSSALSHTYSLLTDDVVDIDNQYNKVVRQRNERHAAVTFKNDLGVPVNLYDSVRGVHILTLIDSTPTSCPPIPMSASESRSYRKSVYPSLFDLRFTGKLDSERAPLLQLPLNIR